MNTSPPTDWRLGVFFAIAFPVFWCWISFMTSVLGGWHRLAKRYRARSTVRGSAWTAPFAKSHCYATQFYGFYLKVTANEDGIGLALPFMFRVGHPALFIPWSEIVVSRTRRLWVFERIRFTFPVVPRVWLEIGPGVGGKIQKAIGREWFAEAN
jgi:hypothetical protein